jgi:hypothetical protein
MSTPTTLQSNLVPLAVSTDGNTYRIIVCKKVANYQADIATTKEDTDCGAFKGLGALDWSCDIDATVNTTPNTPTETSWKEINDWMIAQTLLYIKFQSPTSGSAGADFYIQGQAYITSVKLTATNGSLVSFTAKFDGQGSPDTTR